MYTYIIYICVYIYIHMYVYIYIYYYIILIVIFYYNITLRIKYNILLNNKTKYRKNKFLLFKVLILQLFKYFHKLNMSQFLE